jgi:hypothetical protein
LEIAIEDLSFAHVEGIFPHVFFNGSMSYPSSLLELNFPSGASVTPTYSSISFSTLNGAVPEPATWAMLLIGFGGIGTAVRARRRAPVKAST